MEINEKQMSIYYHRLFDNSFLWFMVGPTSGLPTNKCKLFD